MTGGRSWPRLGLARLFAAIDRHLRVAHGHASMKDVRRAAGDNKMDKMESFWLAETLKY